MDSNIQLFNYRENPVRTIEKDGQIWFVAKDICDILELGNITETLRSLDDDELSSVILKSGGQNREMRLVSESGMYALVFKSRKEEAKKFRKWVTSEVLPQIRETGRYVPEGEQENLPAVVEEKQKENRYISRGMFQSLKRLYTLAVKCKFKEDFERVLALDFAFKNQYGQSALELLGLKFYRDPGYKTITPSGREITIGEYLRWEKDPSTISQNFRFDEFVGHGEARKWIDTNCIVLY